MKTFETVEKTQMNSILGGTCTWTANTGGTRQDGTCYTDSRDCTGSFENDPDFAYDSERYNYVDVPCAK
jgi:hypothetical protein